MLPRHTNSTETVDELSLTMALYRPLVKVREDEEQSQVTDHMMSIFANLSAPSPPALVVRVPSGYRFVDACISLVCPRFTVRHSSLPTCLSIEQVPFVLP